MQMDTKDFERGAKKVKAEASNLSTSLSDKLSPRSLGLLAIGAAATGVHAGISLIKQAVQEFNQIGDLSARFSADVEQVQRLKFALQQTSGEIESLLGFMDRLGRDSLDLGKAEKFADLGLDVEKFKQAYLSGDIEEQTALLADAWAKASGRGSDFFTVMGDGLREFIPLLEEGRGGINELKGAIDTLSKSDIKSLKEFDNAMEAIMTKSKIMAGEVIPGLMDSFEGFSEEGARAMLSFDSIVNGDITGGLISLHRALGNLTVPGGVDKFLDKLGLLKAESMHGKSVDILRRDRLSEKAAEKEAEEARREKAEQEKREKAMKDAEKKQQALEKKMRETERLQRLADAAFFGGDEARDRLQEQFNQEDKIEAYRKAMEKHGLTTKEVAEATHRYAVALKQLADVTREQKQIEESKKNLRKKEREAIRDKIDAVNEELDIVRKKAEKEIEIEEEKLKKLNSLGGVDREQVRLEQIAILRQQDREKNKSFFDRHFRDKVAASKKPDFHREKKLVTSASLVEAEQRKANEALERLKKAADEQIKELKEQTKSLKDALTEA